MVPEKKKIQITKGKGHKVKRYFSGNSCNIVSDALEGKKKPFRKTAAAIMLLHYRLSGAEAMHPFCLFLH